MLTLYCGKATTIGHIIYAAKQLFFSFSNREQTFHEYVMTFSHTDEYSLETELPRVVCSHKFVNYAAVAVNLFNTTVMRGATFASKCT